MSQRKLRAPRVQARLAARFSQALRGFPLLGAGTLDRRNPAQRFAGQSLDRSKPRLVGTKIPGDNTPFWTQADKDRYRYIYIYIYIYTHIGTERHTRLSSPHPPTHSPTHTHTHTKHTATKKTHASPLRVCTDQSPTALEQLCTSIPFHPHSRGLSGAGDSKRPGRIGRFRGVRS